MVVDYRLFLLFEGDGGFEGHDAAAIFAVEPVLVYNRSCHFQWLIILTPIAKFVSTSCDINLISNILYWRINRKIDFKAFPNIIELNSFVSPISLYTIMDMDTTSIDLR